MSSSDDATVRLRALLEEGLALLEPGSGVRPHLEAALRALDADLGGPPRVRGRLSHLFLFVRDLQASARFYRDQLGLPVVFDVPGALFLRLDPGTLLALYPGPGPEGTSGFPVLDVVDLDEAVAALRSRGVDVGAIEPVPYGRAALLRDPDGHVVELHEPA